MAKGVEETETGVKVSFEVKGEIQTVEADYVLVTVGRRPNTQEIGLEQVGVKMTDRASSKSMSNVVQMYQTSMQSVISFPPPLAHKASYEGKVAVEAISGHASAIDYIGIPAVCFTDPELASVGYTKNKLKKLE